MTHIIDLAVPHEASFGILSGLAWAACWGQI